MVATQYVETAGQGDSGATLGDVAALRREIADLKEMITAHLGLDYGRVQAPNAPHPNQQVSTIEFNDGITQLRNAGMEISSTLYDQRPPVGMPFLTAGNDEETTYGGIYFIRDFVDDPTIVDRGVHGGHSSARTGGEVKSYMLAIRSDAQYGQVLAGHNGITGYVRMSAYSTSYFAGYYPLFVNSNGSYMDASTIQGIRLPLAQLDPTGTNLLQDGIIYYRQNGIYKIRLRANGTWQYLASETWVASAPSGWSRKMLLMGA